MFFKKRKQDDMGYKLYKIRHFDNFLGGLKIEKNSQTM
jgi:hypothetical protein